MKKVVINITDIGTINFNNRPVRCPTKLIVTDKQQLKDLETILRINSMKFTTEEIKDKIIIPSTHKKDNKTKIPITPIRPSRLKNILQKES